RMNENFVPLAIEALQPTWPWKQKRAEQDLSLVLSHRLRQLRHVGRNPLRLIFREQLGRLSTVASSPRALRFAIFQVAGHSSCEDRPVGGMSCMQSSETIPAKARKSLLTLLRKTKRKWKSSCGRLRAS